jgi:hypothetical protein
LERAQALACYPQPDEVRRPSRFVHAYTRLFGTGFDPRFAVGRCVAFTREAWKAVDGFPEHLATGEDVSFGLAISRIGAVATAPDALVGWTQRDGIAATWRMYRGYGRSSTDGGDRALLVRDGVRGLAYLAAPLLALHPAGRRLVAAGALAYLSLPVARAVKAHAGPATFAALPVALATKDLGKLAGALQGLTRRSGRCTASSWSCRASAGAAPSGTPSCSPRPASRMPRSRPRVRPRTSVDMLPSTPAILSTFARTSACGSPVEALHAST